MNTYKLTTTDGWNPYSIGGGYQTGKRVNDIHFYDDDGIVASVGEGWIGNNRIDIKEFHELEFNLSQELNLTEKQHFFVASKKRDSRVIEKEESGTM